MLTVETGYSVHCTLYTVQLCDVHVLYSNLTFWESTIHISTIRLTAAPDHSEQYDVLY